MQRNRTSHRITRRRLLALACLSPLPLTASADSLLKDSDSEAKAMGYHEDASTVSASRYPQYKPGQTCSNCSLYSGAANVASGPCSVFMDKDVAATGWCTVWEAKS
ncbi:MAG TPA: high-potential iron-sulfur protein [Aquabacterium sp.]|nr:high-potential iron-sulfur protein [Aquabacterium sp.]